ncbi:fungal hydrophobin [Lentinula edodes]|uniref:fungal hydrophobin n=1 Tax=Lentinula edodes TaxID=5353 RepID=UPI001E8ECEDD|nr:fungal hydrophobin [Lentinula edodes]KAH7872165.1 fungal hydrophobin [Lentinula edodes]
MRFKITFVTVTITSLAAAIPTLRTEPASSCSTGPVRCCQTVESAQSSSAAGILSTLEIVLQDLQVIVLSVSHAIPLPELGQAGAAVLQKQSAVKTTGMALSSP